MNPSESYTIEEYIKMFEGAKRASEEFASGIGEEDFLTRPDSKSWSIAECYSHLNKYNTLYLQEIKPGIRAAGDGSNEPGSPLQLGRITKWIVGYLEPPVGVKIISPGSFKPKKAEHLNKEQTLSRFNKIQDEFIDQLSRSQRNKLDLSQIKVPHPLFSLIKMSIASCIAITEAHQRRHLQQAKNTFAILRKMKEH